MPVVPSAKLRSLRPRSVIAATAGGVAALLALTACGGGNSEAEAAPEPKVIIVHEPAAPNVEPTTTEVAAPPDTPAPTAAPAPADTTPSTTTPPAPEPTTPPAPVNIDIDVNAPQVAPPPAPVYVPVPAPAPQVVPYDPWLIAPGTIEDGVHFGYLVDYGQGWISFDRADVAADGTWTNSNPKVRTMPWAYEMAGMWLGMPIEVQVVNQHVAAVWAV